MMAARKLGTLAGITLLAAPALLADFSYQESTQITGGAMASLIKVVGIFSKQSREPMQSSVLLKGDVLARRSANHLELVDLANQTITSVDLQKKTYSVMTFEQMKQMLNQVSEKMQEQKNSNSGQVNWKVSAAATGNTKPVAGYDAKEMLIQVEMEGADSQTGQKGSMKVTSHVWIASVPGAQELRDFYRRMAEKLDWSPGSNLLLARPDVSKGLAQAYKEIAKLDGTPVEQTISVGVEGSSPAGDGAQASPPPPQSEESKPSLGGALGGALGGRFGLGRRKPSSQQQSQGSSRQSAQPGSLLDMTVQYSNFSTAPVDSSQFAVPAGFKKVEPDVKMAR